jgi:tripartite-type tricarboxylate transporter receptor subunit TctC
MQNILVSARTPKPIIELLQCETVQVLKAPEMIERLVMLGYEAVGRAPDEFAAWIKTQISKWKKVIRAANIQAEQRLVVSPAHKLI